MRKTTAPNYYEMLPKDIMFVTPVVRSIKEVMVERMKVAQWFEPDEEKAQVLTGSCAIFKSSLRIEGQYLVVNEPIKKIPPVLHLQDMIDIYNHLTAEDVLKMYKKPKRKKKL